MFKKVSVAGTMVVLLLLSVGRAFAQTTVLLPDTSQVTTLTATVSEQARITVPSGVTFNVADTANSTASSNVSLAISNVVLSTATKQLRVAIQADAASFTPPVGGATTWSASNVSWNAASWTAATGATGTLSGSAYNTVATCDAGAAACSTSGLVFTLGANSAVQRSGNHTLVIRWRLESTGS